MKKFGSDAVMVSSFTRAASEEIGSRGIPVDKHQVGTLHSFCFHALNRPEIAETRVKEFNEAVPHFAISGERASNLDDPYSTKETDAERRGKTKNGDALMARAQRFRAKLIPEELWPRAVRAFHRRWCDWKEAEGLMDFTDMIERGIEELDVAPGNPRVGFLDEAQDFSLLQMKLVRQWSKSMDYILLAGDDDQCHPAGTKILTSNRGYVSIENILPKIDFLTTYNKRGQEIYNSGKQTVQVAKREFKGQLVKISTQENSVQTTFDHRIMTRWSKKARGRKCVYLMQKGNTWRIGTTDLIRRKAKGIFGIGQRARQEQAEKAWLLFSDEDWLKALLEEDRLALKYGISKMVFRVPTSGRLLPHSQASIDAHHKRVALDASPFDLLNDFNLKYEFPIWEPDGKQRGITAHQKIRACNVCNEIMEVAIYGDSNKKDVKWKSILNVQKDNDWVGDVYSLNVEPYHTYIANRIIMPNCLYHFAGATPDVLLEPALPEKQIQILEKSWRVPQAVHRVAERWINKVKERQPKNYLPTDEPGAVLFSQGNIAQPNLFMKKVEQYVAQGESVMILASCSYMLQATIKQLRSVGLPFWNPFRKTNGAWNPFSKRKGCNMAQDRLLAFTNPTLGFPPVWSIEDLVKWVEPLQSKGTVLRGAKDRPKLHMEAEWEMPEGDPVSYRIRLMEYFPEEIIDELFVQLHNGPDPNWFMDRVLKRKLPVFQFPFKVMKKRGEVALQEPPLVIPGTIHSVKGAESDHVFLMPDLSMAGSREWVKTGRSKDAIYRMFYVGFTRARKTLHLCRPATSYSVNFSQFNDLARKN